MIYTQIGGARGPPDLGWLCPVPAAAPPARWTRFFHAPAAQRTLAARLSVAASRAEKSQLLSVLPLVP
jgi:hypothetical protein